MSSTKTKWLLLRREIIAIVTIATIIQNIENTRSTTLSYDRKLLFSRTVTSRLDYTHIRVDDTTFRNYLVDGGSDYEYTILREQSVIHRVENGVLIIYVGHGERNVTVAGF